MCGVRFQQAEKMPKQVNTYSRAPQQQVSSSTQTNIGSADDNSSSEDGDSISHIPSVPDMSNTDIHGQELQDNHHAGGTDSSALLPAVPELNADVMSELSVDAHSMSGDSDMPVSDSGGVQGDARPYTRRFDFLFSDASDEDLFEGFGADDDDDMGMDRFSEIIVFLESGEYFDNDGTQGDAVSDDGELSDDPFERELIGLIPEPTMSLHAAAMHGNMKELKRWKQWKLGYGGQKIQGSSPMHCAARSGDVATLESLIEQGFPLNPDNQREVSPLILAAKNGHVAVVKALLRHGAGGDPDEMDRAFAITRSWEVVKALAEQDPVDSYGSSEELEKACPWLYQMLFRVVQKGRVAMLKGLLDMGANANCSGILGWTPLQIAARRGHIRCVSLLLECGADVTGRDDFKWTALHYAAREGHHDIALMLLDAGAELDAKCRTGRTPHDVATDEATRYLLENYVQQR